MAKTTKDVRSLTAYLMSSTYFQAEMRQGEAEKTAQTTAAEHRLHCGYRKKILVSTFFESLGHPPATPVKFFLLPFDPQYRTSPLWYWLWWLQNSGKLIKTLCYFSWQMHWLYRTWIYSLKSTHEALTKGPFVRLFARIVRGDLSLGSNERCLSKQTACLSCWSADTNISFGLPFDEKAHYQHGY